MIEIFIIKQIETTSPICRAKKNFSKKYGRHAQLPKGFWHHAKIQRNVSTQFQENTQTDVRR